MSERLLNILRDFGEEVFGIEPFLIFTYQQSKIFGHESSFYGFDACGFQILGKLLNIRSSANLDCTVILQVHDELLFEVKESDAEAAMKLIKPAMEAAAHLSIPLTVETGTARNWEAAH